MGTSKKKRYIEFQLVTNKCWYIAKLLPFGRYDIIFSKALDSQSYNPWDRNWTWMGACVFTDCPTLEKVNENYQIAYRAFLTEDDLFIKAI